MFSFFGPFLTQMGPKHDFCPRSNTFSALLQSNIGNLMKIFKSCPKVIQRTLPSGQKLAEIFIIQCDFTGINDPTFERDPTFEYSNPHWQNTTMCRKQIKTSKSETAGLVKDVPRKSVLIISIEKDPIFFRIMPEKSS